MFHVEPYLNHIGIRVAFLLTTLHLPVEVSIACGKTPQQVSVCSWHDSNFSDVFDWFQLLIKGTSDIGLAYISNLSSRENELLRTFDHSEENGILQITARRIDAGVSFIPICFLLFADYKLVVDNKEKAFRNHLTRQLAKWLNISADFVNNIVLSKGSIIVRAEIRVTENEKQVTSNSVNEFHMEIRKGIVTMTDLWNNELQAAPLRVYHNKDGKLDGKAYHHRRKVRSSNGIPVQLKFDADYGKTVEGREEVFKEHLKKEIAKTIRVPLSSIADMNLRKDKVTADFVLMVTNDHNNVMDESTVEEAASDLRGKIHSGKLKVTDLDANILQVVAVESTVKASLVPASTDLTPIVLGVLLGVFLLMFILVILAGIIVQHVNKSCKRSVSPYGKRSTYRTFQNDDGRDSINSIGKYSYDSGVWIGPGPEPKRKVPEAPLYRPPTVLQVRETPRPCTAVRVRLKDDWNIDPETTFGLKIEESIKE